DALKCFLRFRRAQEFSGARVRNSQILHGAKLILDRVLMTKVGNHSAVFFAQRSNVLSLPVDFAGCRSRQYAQDSQEAGLAAAIWPAQLDQFTCGRREVQIFEQAARSAHASKVLCLEHSRLSTD